MQYTRAPHRRTTNRPSHAAKATRSFKLQCHASAVWRQLGTKAWVAHPRAARVKGVIHFLGGAFAGAAPQLLYNSFIEQLADAGYTTIATPYAVTFRHDTCAKEVRQTFLRSIAELKSTGRSYLVPNKAAVFGIGHSNGALLHLLIGSLEPNATAGNVIISYNNLQVSDAIPIPGFLDTLQPTVQAARRVDASVNSSYEDPNSSSSSGSSTPKRLETASASYQLLAAAAAVAGPLLAEQQQQLLVGATPALDQLASVINEVGDGLTDFRPTPQESRAIIAAGYCCPHTLLVQFENDTIDETPEMQQILTNRFPPNAVSDSAAAAAAAAAVGEESADANAAAVVEDNAWSSIDEDIDVDRVLAVLSQLQQQQQQQYNAGAAVHSAVQQLVLPGSHVTPCGGQFGPPVTAEFKSMTSQVLNWLHKRRVGGVQQVVGNAPLAAAGAGVQQQQQQQQETVNTVTVASAGS